MSSVITKAYLTEMRNRALADAVPIMLPETETVLAALIRARKPERILEIGTAIGYSGSVMLLLEPLARLVTIEIDGDRFVEAKANFAKLGLTDRVTAIEGDAAEVLPLLTGDFDFIFLDGPKGQYAAYLPFLIEHLSQGGLLVADNVKLHGLVTEEDNGHKNRTVRVNMLSFLKAVAEDERLVSETLEYGDGIALCYKK